MMLWSKVGLRSYLTYTVSRSVKFGAHLCYFFFSSRRRHTRFDCDWSSDVCSSDLHQPNAHTDGDSLIFFRKSDVIAAGDLFVTEGYPFIDLNAGGNVQGIVAGLNRIVDLCIPVYGQEGGTMVIPGHGRLSDVGDVINVREMVTIVRDRVQEMVKKNMTLEQVKAAKPTRDYDTLYSTPGAYITGDAFVEAVYRSLKK